MAVQDGQLNGTELGVYIGGTLIAYSTNATLNINQSLRSTTNKESAGFEENMEGLRNWDVSVDALYAWLDPAGSAISNKTLSDIFTGYMATRAKFDLTFGSTSTTGIGFTKYTGSAWLTSVSVTAPMEDTATFSCSFQGTGALTQTIDTTP